MNNKSKTIKFALFIIICLTAFFINNYYGNLGLYPMDSLSIVDTGYSILKGKHPFKDFWVFSGPLLDYIQALFFKLLGLKWSSLVYHASLFNVIISGLFFLVLIQLNLNIYISFIFSISLAILCYPVAGTPFTYQHSFILSLVSILIFVLAIKFEDLKFWFFLPILMVLSFLSMQIPSGFINFLLLIFITSFFILEKNKKKVIYFILGSVTTLILLLIFFTVTAIPLSSFIEQYFLFPMTIGGNRIVGDESAWESANLINKLTFRGLIGHFKFIHIFIFSLIILTSIKLLKKLNQSIILKDLIINLLLIFSSVVFIFHQLITANQTFIFSLIPILGGFVYLQLNVNFPKKNIFKVVILLLVCFSTWKYHNVYNDERKFMDLQHADLTKYVDARILDEKLEGLKWITPWYKDDPLQEILLLKKSIEIIKNDNRNKMLISNYQFFSFLLEEDLNIPNRWYFRGNHIFPLKGHKHFKFYKKHFNRSIFKNNIEVIYIIVSIPSGEISIDEFKPYLDNVCFKSENRNSITSSHVLIECKE